jgi:hypothetical protein
MRLANVGFFKDINHYSLINFQFSSEFLLRVSHFFTTPITAPNANNVTSRAVIDRPYSLK